MAEDTTDKKENKSVSRRDFLKILGVGTAGLATLAVANSGLYSLLNQASKGIENTDNQQFPLGHFIDTGYPAVSWTQANLAVAVSILDGQVIEPGAKFSLLDKLLPDPDKIDYINTDPTKGFVFGLDPGNPFERAPASGICKSATDLFRYALSAPIGIEKAYTHNHIYPHHPFFKNYPYGTDAAIYLDPAAGLRYDLVLKNPFNFPLVLNYQLYDKRGEKINPKDLMKREISFSDYSLGLWVKYIEGMQQANLAVPPGVIPNLVGTKNITSRVFFTPQNKDCVVPDWKVSVKGPVKLENSQYQVTRNLTIDGQESVYQRVTNYL